MTALVNSYLFKDLELSSSIIWIIFIDQLFLLHLLRLVYLLTFQLKLQDQFHHSFWIHYFMLEITKFELFQILLQRTLYNPKLHFYLYHKYWKACQDPIKKIYSINLMFDCKFQIIFLWKKYNFLTYLVGIWIPIFSIALANSSGSTTPLSFKSKYLNDFKRTYSSD